MNAGFAAWRVSGPIISHFSQRPRHGNHCLSCEQTGVTGLVNSLIIQLVQFNVEDDYLKIGVDVVKKLDGSSESLPDALNILYRLLVSTPVSGFFVVRNLNTFEWGGNQEWCHDFLDMVFRAQKEFKRPFEIRLTTSGSSKVFAKRIPVESWFFAAKGVYEVAIKVQKKGQGHK